jgi:toxin YoeB
MRVIFSRNAWDDYLFWQEEDKRMVRKIQDLIRSIRKTPYEGLGQPESLRYDLAGFWVRKIDREHRLVYQVVKKDLLIYTCRFHFDK